MIAQLAGRLVVHGVLVGGSLAGSGCVTREVVYAPVPDRPVVVAPPPAQPGRPFNDYSAVPLAAATDVATDQASLSFLVPVIPAGFTGVLEFTLTPPASSPHGAEFSVDASIGKSWFENGAVRADILAEAATVARAFAERATGVSTTPALDPMLIAYERNALELAVTPSPPGSGSPPARARPGP